MRTQTTPIRRWTGGQFRVVVFLGDTFVAASKSTQRSITLSTIEAEYVAMGERVKSGMYIKVALPFVQPQLSGTYLTEGFRGQRRSEGSSGEPTEFCDN